MPQLYSVEESISAVIKLPDGETISKQAVDIHGVTDHACQQGQSLGRVFRFIVAWLKQDAEICCHNLAHPEKLAFVFRILTLRTLNLQTVHS